ncbi:MAG: 16S rRNA (guanine(527)-N(7))-methyltransferase RsmG [Ignavibacteria bacterium]|jgi:16S rRNA (guanine527-N7)-methyltransferase|nr:16S rRNA (guanine(527)-N(7))-methyltransferase RsmG [Ignavibacteria bacterium]
MEFTEFWTILSTNNIILDVNQIEQFKRFENELKYWNNKVNLISRKDEDNILERHFIHSLSILKYIDLPKKVRCLDFGTGGGFPGIPLKIAMPDIFMTLCDSIKKKLKIAEIFALHTGLKNFNFECSRVEELDKKYYKRFDFIFARAVAKTNLLVEWTLPFLKNNGKFVFLKGGALEEEIAEVQKKHPNLNVEEIQIDMLDCPWFKNEEKKIIIINKK